MSNIFLLTLLGFGILAGSKATTDGYTYLGHNEDIPGEKMLNIYNVPSGNSRLAGLWFEFPGQMGDSYVNEYGVAIASDQCRSREDRPGGSLVYETRTTAIQKARVRRASQRHKFSNRHFDRGHKPHPDQSCLLGKLPQAVFRKGPTV